MEKELKKTNSKMSLAKFKNMKLTI